MAGVGGSALLVREGLAVPQSPAVGLSWVESGAPEGMHSRGLCTDACFKAHLRRT